MFELVGTLVEAVAGYLGGWFQGSKRAESHVGMLVLSLLCGLVAFVGYGVYELVAPSPKRPDDWAYALALFSLLASILMFLLLELVAWIEKKRAKSRRKSVELRNPR